MKLMLVDGNSVLNRAFYGVPPLTNSKGVYTNAVYGFLNILLRHIEEDSPDLICVAFSAEERNFIMKKAKYYAELATRRKYDLGDGERISMIWRKLLHSNSPDVA